MAIYYADNLLGNDSTGNGTAGNPYQTFTRAYADCVSGDEVRLAGSKSTAGAGTFTFNTSNTVTTSVDLTGVLVKGDIITIEDPIAGADIFYYMVFAVTSSTTVTLTAQWSPSASPFAGRTMNWKKVDAVHYYSTSFGTNFIYNGVYDRDVTVSGGWTNGFAAQDGLTHVVYGGTSPTTSSGVFFRATGGNNFPVGFTGFSLNNVATFLQNMTGPCYLGDHHVNNSSSSTFLSTLSGPPAGYTATNLVLSDCGQAFGSTNAIGVVGTGDPVSQWTNAYFSNNNRRGSGSTIAYKFTNFYGYNPNGTGNPSSTTAPFATNVIADNVYIVNERTDVSTQSSPIFGTTNLYVKALVDWQYIGGTDVAIGLASGSNASGSYLDITSATTFPRTKLVGSNAKPLNETQYARGLANIVDPAGTIVLRGLTPYEVDATQFDTGVNSLKMYRNAANGFGTIDNVLRQIYQAEAPAGDFRITVRAKADATPTVPAQFCFNVSRFDLSGNASDWPQINTAVLDTTWQDFSIDILASDNYAYKTFSVNLFTNVASNVTTVWIDSVTVTAI